MQSVKGARGETRDTKDPELTIKIVRRRNGDRLEINDRIMNGNHTRMQDDPDVLAGGLFYIQQLLREFYNATIPAGQD